MRFVRHWDTLLINMLNLCPSNKSILTAYPASYTPPRILNNNFVTGITFDKFHESGIITFKGSGEDLSKFHLPQLGTFIAGGFMFSSSSIIDEVPADPNIYFLGEEFLFSSRAWTRGWDIYHPNKLLCWHYYNEKFTARPLHWQDNEWIPLNYSSAERFRQILALEGSTEDFGIYGLGCESHPVRVGSKCVAFPRMGGAISALGIHISPQNIADERLCSRDFQSSGLHQIILCPES